MLADTSIKLLQCLGVRCRVIRGGFLAGCFGIILGCRALGGGACARLAVGPAGGQRGASAAAIPAGRVSSATSFFNGGLQTKVTRVQLISFDMLKPPGDSQEPCY